jgi:hypothetical protein
MYVRVDDADYPGNSATCRQLSTGAAHNVSTGSSTGSRLAPLLEQRRLHDCDGCDRDCARRCSYRQNSKYCTCSVAGLSGERVFVNRSRAVCCCTGSLDEMATDLGFHIQPSRKCRGRHSHPLATVSCTVVGYPPGRAAPSGTHVHQTRPRGP